ncbi:MAG: hypothetical protein AMJ91_00995 [candidate division Zixibacteria bacterium SM23_73_3]|nr:MAG: hypothetical protein AMJ91_00995 [candidate division Zixibacteria bacterium SM23_73_3]
MKKLSLFIAGLMLVSLFVGSFAMGAMEVKVGKGDLKIGGILQAGFTYNVEDEKGNDSFTLNRARFLFWGTIVPDKVKYFVQLDHKGSISVLDYKAQFFYIEKTEIAVGRFLPNFTLYMPYSTAKLEMINYPYTTTKYAVWRQCGIQSTTTTEYVDFNLGIFNGGDTPNNWDDNNDAKDFLVRADVKPPIEEAEVRFGGYAWIGFAPPPSSWEDPEDTFKRNRYGGFAKADYTKDDVTVRFRGEFIAAEDEYANSYKDSEGKETWNSQAFFGHLGVQPVPQVEFLVRYDSYDPCTDEDNDGMSAITGGVNYYIDGINAMFYLNFIHNMEQGEVQAQAQITF